YMCDAPAIATSAPSHTTLFRSWDTLPNGKHDRRPLHFAGTSRDGRRGVEPPLRADSGRHAGADDCLGSRRAIRSGAKPERQVALDRKSTRLNSSHEWISYAVFC